MPRNQRPRLVVILGPTAAGKTDIAIQLAERLNGEIVSADSRLFYRGMDIGTAKPSPEERKRVPHHLIDVADPDQVWSLALFKKAAHQAVLDIHRRGRLPFLVGGSGQYIRAIIEDWTIPETGPNLPLREALENWVEQVGVQELFERLASLDPQAASKMDPRNVRRTVRALEIILTTGERFSEQKKRGGSPYHLLLVGLNRPRPELYARIDARIKSMLEAGFVDEVRDLLAAGYSPDLPTLSAIGYPQMINVLEEKITLEESVAQMKRLTRQFVRRQANWFKPTDPDIHWFRVDDQTVDDAERMIRAWLSSQS